MFIEIGKRDREGLELLHAAGVRGLPVESRGKKATMADWPTNAVFDVAEWERWLAAGKNIGLTPPANILVIDEDVKDEGPANMASWEAEHGSLPETLTVKTPSGGQHRVFRLPKGVTVKNSVGVLPGVDIRTSGGYVVAPPSETDKGKYKFTSLAPIADAPPALIELLTSGRARDKPVGADSPVFPTGQRNAGLTSIAGRLRRSGHGYDEIIALLEAANSQRCQPPLTDDEVETIARSVCNYAPDASEIAKEQARAAVEGMQDVTAEAVFDGEFLKALVLVERHFPGGYAAFMERCRGKINSRNLNKALRGVKAEMRSSEQPTVAEDMGLPIGLTIPPGWRLDASGVSEIAAGGIHKICPVPLVITGRRISLDAEVQKLTIAWRSGAAWKSATVPRSAALDARKLIALADMGAPVSSENCRGLVRWLVALEGCNSLPVEKSVSRLGWHGKLFAPVDDVPIDSEGGTAEFASAYRAAGDLERWKERTAEVRRHPFARFMLASAVTAPLLMPLGVRNFLVLLWAPSRAGKTAAMAAAASIWGDYREAMVSLNTTTVGAERLAQFHNDMPILLDEKQHLRNPQTAAALTYLLGGGRGRLRGSKTGLQQTGRWRTVALLTGEERLSTDAGFEGVKSRLLEVRGNPFDSDDDAAKAVYDWAGQHYGYAGKLFVDYVRNNEAKIKECFTANREMISQERPALASSHTDALAVIATADGIFSEAVWGVSDDEALGDMIYQVADALDTATEIRDATRMADFLESWIARQGGCYNDAAWARIVEEGVEGDVSVLWVLASEVDNAFQQAGFSPSKARGELREAGVLRTFIENGRPVATKQRRFNGARPRMVAIVR